MRKFTSTNHLVGGKSTNADDLRRVPYLQGLGLHHIASFALDCCCAFWYDFISDTFRTNGMSNPKFLTLDAQEKFHREREKYTRKHGEQAWDELVQQHIAPDYDLSEKDVDEFLNRAIRPKKKRPPYLRVPERDSLLILIASACRVSNPGISEARCWRKCADAYKELTGKRLAAETFERATYRAKARKERSEGEFGGFLRGRLHKIEARLLKRRQYGKAYWLQRQYRLLSHALAIGSLMRSIDKLPPELQDIRPEAERLKKLVDEELERARREFGRYQRSK